jgi:hypothetical protein
MKRKIKALILFANPKKTLPLKTRKERGLIEKAIKSSKHLEVTFVDASTIHDLRRYLLSDKYHIVQISAHGTPDGLVLETEDGEPHMIEPKALANYLKKYRSLECLVFNACHSMCQGVRTMLSIPYTIAMEDTIADKAALEFSRGFYDVISRGKSYEEAYVEGVQNAGLCYPNAKFRAELLKRDDSNREASYEETTEKAPAIKIFTNIWFEDHKYSIWSVRNAEVGTLSVFSDRLEFSGSETDLQITGIIRVRHTKMGGDVNNNWVEVLYQNGESVRLAYLSAASTLGVGNLLGGSEELFDFLYKHFTNRPPAKENDNSSKGAQPQPGNIVSAGGSGNVVIGGNVTNSKISAGKSTPKPPRKK